VLDGAVLGDSAWTCLIPASGFWQVQPDDGERATQETDVYVGFSGDALYIGVIAYDDDPDGILVTDSRRDSQLADTDSFQVILDGLRDGQNGFVFGTNLRFSWLRSANAGLFLVYNEVGRHVR
jgi:hypothetical protein